MFLSLLKNIALGMLQKSIRVKYFKGLKKPKIHRFSFLLERIFSNQFDKTKKSTIITVAYGRMACGTA